MKKYLKLLVLILLLFVSGCESKVEKLKKGIEIQYVENDNKNSVTKNFYLPLEIDGYPLTWETGSPYLEIDGDRVIIKPNTVDNNATLTASFIYKEKTYNVSFIIKIIGDNSAIEESFDFTPVSEKIIMLVPKETKSDLYFPTLVDGVMITWISSDESVISNTGVVIRQNEDFTVNLTVELRHIFNSGIVKETRLDFSVKVLKKDSSSFDFSPIINQIEIPSVIDGNISLPTLIDDVSVVWVSSDESIISNTGVVVRPNEDTLVSLVAKLKKGLSEKNVLFTVNVLGLFDFSPVINQIEIPNEIDNDISLPTLIDGVMITWVSSNESVISNTGVIVRQNEDTLVSLTAKLKKGSNEKNVLFTVKVLKKDVEPDVEIIFEGYYASLSGLSGNALKDALRTLIKNTGRATGTTSQVQQADKWQGSYYLIYTGMGPYGNREHVWPQSKLKLENAPVDDMHNLRACNGSVNSSRGNLSFVEDGKPFTGSQTYGRVNGGWYPGDEHIGDVARIVLYLHIRYNLNINNVGSLNTFLIWHELDPVNEFEQIRNGRIEEIQGNRNPFIDHPELVEIYFGSKPTSFTIPLSLISATLKMNEHYNMLIN